MAQKRIHFPLTTAQQRRLLFETWEATGYAALDEFASLAPQRTRRLDQTIEQQVIGLRRDHPDWGKDRIADELAKARDWTPIISPNTVRRILRDAGLWEPGAA